MEAPDSAFEAAPLLMQRNIEKKHELRVVCVGEYVFSFIVPSQDYGYTKVDWRYGNAFLHFEPTTLPERVREGLLKVLSDLELDYGSFDLIVTPQDEYFYIECNPDGQWGWLDDILNGGISRAFANLLMEVHWQQSVERVFLVNVSACIL